MYNTTQDDGISKSLLKKILIYGGIVLVSLFLLISAITGIKTINEGEIAVKTSLGKYAGTYQPGFIYVIPYFEAIERFDIGVKTYVTTTNPELGDEDYTDVSITMNTQDQVQAKINYTIQFRVNPEKIENLYRYYRSEENAFRQLVKFPSRSIIRDIVNDAEADPILTDISSMEDAVRDRLGPIMENGGLVLVFFGFRDPDLGDYEIQKNEEMVQMQTALVEEQKIDVIKAQAEQSVAVAEGQKEIQILEAEARADSRLVEQEAEAEAQKLIADAEAYTILAEAQAQAEANQLIAGSITPELIEYVKTTTWNGVMPSTFMPVAGGPSIIDILE